MTDITLTDTQAAALKRTVAWFHQCQHEMESRKPLSQQVWRVFGYAGVGKSTILKHILEALRTTPMPKITAKDAEDRLGQREAIRERAEDGDLLVLSMAFTGKAALVMTRKGTPASTIHSAIYTPVEPTEAAIEKAKKELSELLARGPGDEHPHLFQTLVRDREVMIKDMHKTTFVLNTDSVVRDAGLIVLDEVSMVNGEMAADLLSFKKPILVLGDPGQLPPIKGEGFFTQAEPDVMLTEVMRQAAESPIIQLATMAREGRFIPFGRYGDDVFKMRRDEIGYDDMLQADQVICGYNATRVGLNNALKMASGFDDVLPTGNGEKLIVLKNRHADGLINGQFISMSKVKVGKPDDIAFSADITTEDADEVGRFSIYRGHFDDHVQLDKERDRRDYFKKKGRVECVWGWAVTAYKAQGSQFTNVVFFDDGFGRTAEDRNRFLYTTITRAESGLLILA